MTPVSPAWFLSHEALVLREHCRYLLEQGLEGASLVVLSGPQLSQQVPLWLAAARGLGIEPCPTLVVRHPLEAAALLHERSVPFHEALLVWLCNVLQAERSSRGERRVVTFCDELRNDWQAALDRMSRVFGIEWPTPLRLVRPEVDAWIDRGPWGRRFPLHDTPDERALTTWARDTWAGIRDLQAGGTGSAEEALDRVWNELWQAGEAYGPVVSQLRHEVRQLRDALEAQSPPAQVLAAQPAAAPRTDGSSRLLAENAHLELVCAEQSRMLMDLRQRWMVAEQQLAALTAAQTRREAWVAELRSDHAYVVGSRSWRLTAPLRALLKYLRRAGRSGTAPARRE